MAELEQDYIGWYRTEAEREEASLEFYQASKIRQFLLIVFVHIQPQPLYTDMARFRVSRHLASSGLEGAFTQPTLRLFLHVCTVRSYWILHR